MSGTEILQRASLKTMDGGNTASAPAPTQRDTADNGGGGGADGGGSMVNRLVVQLSMQTTSQATATGPTSSSSYHHSARNGFNHHHSRTDTGSSIFVGSKAKETSRRSIIVRDDQDGHLVYKAGDRIDRCICSGRFPYFLKAGALARTHAFCSTSAVFARAKCRSTL
eukprot:m.23912 g.23912  ORF g.23912 m.23912 type:complete len:167 (+) comp28548_c0_seq4:884-1384(+)